MLKHYQMNEFTAVNDVISNAIKNSSYTTVLISSCVFILYTLIIRGVELIKSKHRNKPLIEMANAIKEVSENVVKLNNVLDRTFRNAEAKEAQNCRNIINLAFDSFEFNINDYCIGIVIHNNIHASVETIKSNISKFVNTEYYKLYSLLSAYEFDNRNLSSRLKEEWITEITNECIGIIYNGQESMIRVGQLHAKLQVIVNNYSVYIMNKIFNH